MTVQHRERLIAMVAAAAEAMPSGLELLRLEVDEASQTKVGVRCSLLAEREGLNIIRGGKER